MILSDVICNLHFLGEAGQWRLLLEQNYVGCCYFTGPATAHVVETQHIELDYHLQDISVLLQVFLQFSKHVEQQLFY